LTIGAAVRSDALVPKHAGTSAGPPGTLTCVLAVKGLRPGTERPQHVRRQVVFLRSAVRIAAREEEESGRVIDHDSPKMLDGPASTRAILNIELETDEGRHLVAKPRRVVLPRAPCRESISKRAPSAVHHRHSMNVTTAHALCWARATMEGPAATQAT